MHDAVDQILELFNKLNLVPTLASGFSASYLEKS